jgi:hypothetical protein
MREVLFYFCDGDFGFLSGATCEDDTDSFMVYRQGASV